MDQKGTNVTTTAQLAYSVSVHANISVLVLSATRRPIITYSGSDLSEKTLDDRIEHARTSIIVFFGGKGFPIEITYPRQWL